MKQNVPFAKKRRQLQYLVKQFKQANPDTAQITSSKAALFFTKIKRLVSELSCKIPSFQLKSILGSTALLIGLTASTNAAAQSFQGPTLNPFGLNSAAYLAAPALADLDGDGDIDLLTIEYDDYTTAKFYENTGGSSVANFSPPVASPFGVSFGEAAYIAFPTLVDLDDDGDFDLLVGGYYGSLNYFENTGSPTAPSFAPPSQNPFGLVSTYYFAIPTPVDLDGDGDLDLMVGDYYGAMQYFENTGSPTSPNFVAPVENPFGFELLVADEEEEGIAYPAFADLDNDGDMDLTMGYYNNVEVSGSGGGVGTIVSYGILQYYENVGGPSNPQFTEGINSPFGWEQAIDGDEYIFPTYSDLDNDGDMDILIGSTYGDFLYYENTGTSAVEETIADYELTVSPNPTNELLQIESQSPIQQIRIYDTSGKLIASIKGQNSMQQAISLSKFNTGFYMLKIRDVAGKIATHKIQKY